MDIATLFGLLAGAGLIVTAIITQGTTGSLVEFIHRESLMIVLGGTIAATLINYPLKAVIGVFGVVKNAFKRHGSEYQDIITYFEETSKTVYEKGIMALEGTLDDIDDHFLRNGLALAINERNPDNLRNYLELELNNIHRRHQQGSEIFFYMGQYSPAFGMLGTIIGLIIMMKTQITIPDSTGAFTMATDFNLQQQFTDLLNGMGLALITTFWGVLLANLVFLPLGGKLERRSEDELMMKEIMIEGILCLHAKDHPLVVKDKLSTFVPQREREMFANQSGGR
ncbi:MAG: MotA/TolQ/ExbB proton channel family protein [Candidatus Marinimicrobia bacterium]|nr:MotA/TolQ/ExbB proton channel family protein [Candidatus Neomarinimicrobiota bacterium]MCF7828854.1 MotA/TolQ/ExbB proton channel family protein [Candidatus Neomarinimicrobiota bacterium]MCF7880771.1 MotA/TolQ/ExbB proton channel family protein [Candidatus Neomarinimicrobiota bacterium]